MTDFEERRLDQLAFAADEAEEHYMKRRSVVTADERRLLKEDMEAKQEHLARFVQGIAE